MMSEKNPKFNDDEKSKARDGQKTHIVDLNKNVLFIVLAYVKSNEIFSLVKSSKRIYKKITVDSYFHTITSEALSKFFLQ
jgi:hypothetical protein